MELEERFLAHVCARVRAPGGETVDRGESGPLGQRWASWAAGNIFQASNEMHIKPICTIVF